MTKTMRAALALFTCLLTGVALAQVSGVAELRLVVQGSMVQIRFQAPAMTLVGFDQTPRSASERASLRLAVENLTAGDGLIRFNTRAGCSLADADVKSGFGDDGNRVDGHREMSAQYRFVCDNPDQIASAAVGLFVGFPALQRVFVAYEIPQGKGRAELTRSRPVVSFVPLE